MYNVPKLGGHFESSAKKKVHSTKCLCKESGEARQWKRTPLIPALRRGRQMDLCEFEVYKSQFQDRLQSYRETLS